MEKRLEDSVLVALPLYTANQERLSLHEQRHEKALRILRDGSKARTEESLRAAMHNMLRLFLAEEQPVD
jgi:hypothetical protein